MTGITSPQSTPVENVDRAGRVYSYYKKFGAIPLKQPSKPDKFFGRDNISKQLKQTSSSREEKELMKSNAMEIINNLLNALEASKMEAKNVKEKNIKATVSSFLKNKNTSIDKLKKYYNTLF